MLITRREGRQLRRYAHLSTGNYNPRTARLYTDLSHLTADVALTTDIDNVFVHLASHSRLPRLSRVLLAPLQLQSKLIQKINAVAKSVRAGQEGRIVAKMNALTDEALVYALIRAGQAGVKVDLIVRGACVLPPQLAGFTDNIRVRSVIGRFLEHSRVFYFRQAGVEELYLSSADWMNRNMLRRVELAWPVRDPALLRRIVDECLVAYLQDDVDAWEMAANGTYTALRGPSRRSSHGAQAALAARYGDLGGTN
jgi:polyphosphate kinase